MTLTSIKAHLGDRSHTGLLLAGALCVAAVALPTSHTHAQQGQQPEQAGVSAAVSGQVLLASNNAVGRAIESGEAIYLGDFIEAGEDASLQVLLMDESVLTLGPNSKLAIDSFIYNPNTQTGAMVLNMAQGSLRFVAGKIASGNPQDMRINVPTGVIGIRGTLGMVQILTPEEAAAAFPDQAGELAGGQDGGGEGGGGPLVFAALTGPGPNSAGGIPGSFTVETDGGGSTDLNQPGSGVLSRSGAPPIPFIPPPGALSSLSSQISGGATGRGASQYTEETDGGGDGDGGDGGDSAGGGDGGTGGGAGGEQPVNASAAQETGQSQPVPVQTILASVEQGAQTGDQGASAIDTAALATVTETVTIVARLVTLQEVITANPSDVIASGALTGTITGTITLSLYTSGNPFWLLGGSINVPGESNPIGLGPMAIIDPSSTSFSSTSIGSCSACVFTATFPSTSTTIATFVSGSDSGTTGEIPLVLQSPQ